MRGLLLELVNAVSEAVAMVHDVVPLRNHEDVRRMYNWRNVAERTEKVRQPCRAAGMKCIFPWC